MISSTPILITVAALLLVSCADGTDDLGFFDDESCPESGGTALVTGISDLRFFEAVESDTTSDSVRYNLAASSATISVNSLMIAVSADTLLQQASATNALSETARIASFLIPKAQALSCIAPSYESTQLLDDISITSDADLSVMYPSGSDLSAVFDVGKVENESDLSGPILDSIGVKLPDARETLPEYLSAEQVTPLFIALTLNVDGVVASQHVFTVTYTLDDGTVFAAQSDTVSIEP